MLCPKCNTQIDDDSVFCKACGAATITDAEAPRLTSLTKKQRGLLILLPGAIAIILLLSGMIMMSQYDPYATIGVVLLCVGAVLCSLLLLFVLFFMLFSATQARSAKEAQRDKQMLDILKKLEDLECSLKH